MKNLSDAILSSSLSATCKSNGINIYVITRHESANMGKPRTVFAFADRVNKNIFVVAEDINEAEIDSRALQVLLWHEATHIVEDTTDEKRCDENAIYHVSKTAYDRLVSRSNDFIVKRRAELGITKNGHSHRYEHRAAF